MALSQKTLNVYPSDWCEDTEALIALALTDGTIADIKEQTDSGVAKLFVLTDEKVETVAAFVLRIDRMAGKNVGVVVAAAGRVSGVNLTAVMMPFIETMFVGCSAIRVHTSRTGLGRKLIHMGYRVSEIILQKEI